MSLFFYLRQHRVNNNNCEKYTYSFGSQTWYFYRTLKLLRYSNLLLINIPPRVLEPGGTLEKHAKRLLFYMHTLHIICRGCLKELYFEWKPPCRHLHQLLFSLSIRGKWGIGVIYTTVFIYLYLWLSTPYLFETSLHSLSHVEMVGTRW